jgi:hypothetical protein
VDVLRRWAAVHYERERAVAGRDVESSRPALSRLEGEHRGDGLPEPPTSRGIPDAEPEVIDRRAAGTVPEPGAGLDAVPVGIQEEAAVVVRVVLGAQPRLSVAAIARIHPTPPEGIDLLARARGEADVEMACHRMVAVCLSEREVVPLVEPVACVRRFAQ